MKHPSYLDMVKILLPPAEFLEFEKWYDKPIKKSIKMLKRTTSQNQTHHYQETYQQLTHDGRTLTPPKFSREATTYDDLLFVEKPDKQSLGSHPLHQQGAFYVQEMAAGLPAQILNIQPNDLVLDMCAAPGGKSIQLADKLWENGLLISNELNPTRRKALEANLERCGIRNAVITGYDGKILGNILSEQCDKVLLDAPCSGEGMQYKSDFKIYHWNEKIAHKLAQTQKSLLLAGLEALKIWGELVYSTCTTNVIENEGVIADVLEILGDKVELLNVEIEEKSPGIYGNNTSSPINWCRDTAVLRCPNPATSGVVMHPNHKTISNNVARFRPHIHHTGGFFIAKFKKIKSIPTPDKNIPTEHPTPERTITHHDTITNSNILLLQTKHTIRAVAKRFSEIKNQLFIQRAGLPIFKILNDGQQKPLSGLKKISER